MTDRNDRAPNGVFGYTIFGLNVWSEIELPEVRASQLADDPGPPVSIRWGKVPRELPGSRSFGPVFETTESACIYRFTDVGAYFVGGGTEIVVEPIEGAAPNDIRAFLLGSALGTILHQRRLLPLHISAVLSPAGVIAFTGESGAGKSTTAFMVNRATGWPVLSDDVAVLRLVEGAPTLTSGLVRLKLWQDALDRFDIPYHDLDRDLMRDTKYHMSAPDLFSGDGIALIKLVHLDWDDTLSVTPLSGLDAFVTLLQAVYRPYLVDFFGDRPAINALCGETARMIETYRLIRSKSDPDGMIAAITELATSQD